MFSRRLKPIMSSRGRAIPSLSSSILFKHINNVTNRPNYPLTNFSQSQLRKISIPPSSFIDNSVSTTTTHKTYISYLLQYGDYFGTACFAFGGALTASTCGLGYFGCILAGSITAVGGGTIRDVIILRRIPFWFAEKEYLVLCVIFAGLALYIREQDNTYDNSNDTSMVASDTASLAFFWTLFSSSLDSHLSYGWDRNELSKCRSLTVSSLS